LPCLWSADCRESAKKDGGGALSTDSDFPCVSIRFTDSTDLTVVIDPWLTFQVDYSKWKAGNQKVLKRWPVFRSDGI
jgi:hypothetical protein